MSEIPLQSVPVNDAVLRRTLEIAVDAIICVDAEQRIIFFNDGAAAMFGHSPTDVFGKPLSMLMPERFRQAHGHHMARFAGSSDAARRMGERGDIAGLRKDGTEFPAEASIAHIQTEQGLVFAVVLRDVTEQRRFETENSELVRDLRGAVAARDDMLSIVSHDLRNPVNAVKMLAAAILRTGESATLPGEVGQHADVMLQAARQMDALIQDLLDVSKIESGRLSMSPRPISIDELLDEATEMLRPGADQAGVEIRLEPHPRLPAADVDPDRIVQVLSNLIGNAIKYTPRGGHVAISAQAMDDFVQVTVADTGVGISEQELPRVFDRFWQSKRTNRSGAGLGLTIARGMVRAHGGRIWIESVSGAGTQVHFTVPRASRPARANRD